ncbi:MAG TPA: ribbon-helix-helix domain-containing protein [Thermoanaerobaculia bacterium]|nr:ribbon-helix-helix domain-containing protein [Thermoanaerobaculia bacterium]
MIRTLISLEDEDKKWLDRKAKEEGLTMTELVRVAVRRYREQCEASQAAESLEQLLGRTAGIWREGDGLAYQRAVRDEWETPEGPDEEA